MATVQEIHFPLPHPALPEADWVDCYQVSITQPFGNARLAASAIVSAFPKWTYPALALRQIVVAPFGLKGAEAATHQDVIGIFPVAAESESEITAGIDDKHLDFRIVVATKPIELGQAISLATLIKRHNWIGRTYLRMVLPFHRAILKSAMRKIARDY